MRKPLVNNVYDIFVKVAKVTQTDRNTVCEPQLKFIAYFFLAD